VSCNPNRVVPGAHRVFDPSIHLSSGSRDVRTIEGEEEEIREVKKRGLEAAWSEEERRVTQAPSSSNFLFEQINHQPNRMMKM
jgi:hypothetical protein